VEPDLRKLFDFIEEQKARQARHFPTVKFEKVLSFMGTTSLAGTHAAVGVLPLVRLEPSSAGRELSVTLQGPLPRLPRRGECLTVHLTNVSQYQGFQVKTRPLASIEAVNELFVARGDELTLLGAQLFTVHHSPYTMKFFEQIPFEEVKETVGAVRYALVGVGEQANISPRFIFHAETRLGRVVLYHGDGLALKTYMNLRSNRQETRLIVDLDDYSGYVLRGTIEEFQPHQHAEAYEKICQGFAAGGWGKPSRTFKFTADTWEPIAPTAPALKRAFGDVGRS
jgi:hypothetical protein